jgi:excisionase family DNA binding protein
MNTIEDLRKQKGLAGVPEVCQVLGVSRNTVFAWIKAGRLKAYRVGNAYRVDRVDLARWLEARQLSQTPKQQFAPHAKRSSRRGVIPRCPPQKETYN